MKDLYGLPKNAVSSEVVIFLESLGITEFLFSDGIDFYDEKGNICGNGMDLKGKDKRSRSVRKINTSDDLFTIIENTRIPDLDAMDEPDFYQGIDFLNKGPLPGHYNAAVVFRTFPFSDHNIDQQQTIYTMMLLKYAVNPPVQLVEREKPILRRVGLH